MKHLYYMWLGIANKWFWGYFFYGVYCFAPAYFHFSAPIGFAWYGIPLAVAILYVIYRAGKYKAEQQR